MITLAHSFLIGTSITKLILDQHPHISTLFNKNIKENEGTHAHVYASVCQYLIPDMPYNTSHVLTHHHHTGQFFQYVYPAAKNGFSWGLDKHMRLTDLGPYANATCRDHVYAAWRQYWNITRPVLIEKSPRHILMTRLLEHW